MTISNPAKSALLATRYSGTRSFGFVGETVNCGLGAELAAANADIGPRLAVLERASRKVLRPYGVKDL